MDTKECRREIKNWIQSSVFWIYDNSSVGRFKYKMTMTAIVCIRLLLVIRVEELAANWLKWMEMERERGGGERRDDVGQKKIKSGRETSFGSANNEANNEYGNPSLGEPS